jgi:hypothetical protein
MTTLVASESSHLVQPGVPFHELDWGFSVPCETPDTESPRAPSSQEGSATATGVRFSREESWVCEWWPPTD